ncbi:MAG: flagellin FliC [Sulfuricella sp.]|nr:flagellin FliC [Sulfuricella sp.]
MLNPVSLKNLDNAQNAAQSSLQRLSSGARINSAKDDAAGLAVAVGLTAQLGGDRQALRNVSDGLSLTETAGGAYSQVSDSLQRMRELAVQAANGTNSPSDLQAIQAEFSQLGESLGQTAGNAQFNGKKLLDGSFSAPLQSGPNPGDSQSLTLGSAMPQSLGIDSLDVTTASNATTALGALDNAIASINSQQANIGAAQAGLNSTLANLSNSYENLAAAKSRIADTDFAAESTALTQSNLKQQAATKALSAYNATQSASVLGLIKA